MNFPGYKSLFGVRSALAAAFVICLSAAGIFAQTGTSAGLTEQPTAPQAFPTPTNVEAFMNTGGAGNVNCSTIANPHTGTDLVTGLPFTSNVRTTDQLLINGSFPTSSAAYSFTYTSGSQSGFTTTRTGTAYPDRNVIVGVNSDRTIAFNSQLPVSAVIVQISNDNYVFYYDLPNRDTFGTTYLGTTIPTNTAQGISHVQFCTDIGLRPTAAPANVGGRVLTDYGTGIRGAYLTLTNLSTGEVRYAVSNNFGYYSFQEVMTDDVYLLTVASKRYNFANNSRTFTLRDSLSGVDFISTPENTLPPTVIEAPALRSVKKIDSKIDE
jgi:hypothetical protein